MALLANVKTRFGTTMPAYIRLALDSVNADAGTMTFAVKAYPSKAFADEGGQKVDRDQDGVAETSQPGLALPVAWLTRFVTVPVDAAVFDAAMAAAYEAIKVDTKAWPELVNPTDA